MTDSERAARGPSPIPPLLLAGLAFVTFAICLPQRLYGDDLWFVFCILTDYPFTAHFLYLPLAKATTWLGATVGLDPLLSLRLLAASGASAGAGLLYTAARRAGAASPAALLFALLPATTAAAFFFATAAELHAVHLGAVALLAWTLVRLDADGPAARVFAVGLAFGVVVGTHKSGVLLFPGLVALYFLATPGRASARRARDLVALASAGALAIGAMLGFTWWQQRDNPAAGGLLAGSDSLAFYVQGFRGRLAQGFTWLDGLEYLSIDAAAPALGLVLVGAFGIGGALRRRPRLGLALLLLALPYLVFFPIFHFFERGAYFVVLGPLLAGAALFAVPASDSPRMPARIAAGVVLAVALAAAPWRPDELTGALGTIAPSAAVLGALALGFAGPVRLADARATRLALVALAVLQLVGALGTLRDFDRTQPTLDWARGAAHETGGDEAIVITYSFERTLVLMVLARTWPAPYDGTWRFAEELPHPTPRSFFYGDPTLTDAQLETELAGHLARGTRIYVDDEVTEAVARQPAIGARLRQIEERYALTEVRREGFAARRVTLRP